MVSIVGSGPNGMEIPCLFFETVEDAEEYYAEHKAEVDDNDHSAFFTDYNDGCGGIDFYKIKEIEPGKPFVAFDLD